MRAMNMLRPGMTAVALALAPGSALACPLAGTYSVAGQVDGGSAYAGQSVISRASGGHCSVVWQPPINAAGNGTIIGSQFAVRYSVDGVTGTVIYTVAANGVLSGKWMHDGQLATGRETMTPAGAPSPEPNPPAAGPVPPPSPVMDALRTRRGERFGAISRLKPMRAWLESSAGVAKVLLLNELRLESPPESAGSRTVWRACFPGACAQGNAAFLADFDTGSWALCLTDIALGWSGEMWFSPEWTSPVTLPPAMTADYAGCAAAGSTEANNPQTVMALFRRLEEARASSR
jgi:hypothetical protein